MMVVSNSLESMREWLLENGQAVPEGSFYFDDYFGWDEQVPEGSTRDQKELGVS